MIKQVQVLGAGVFAGLLFATAAMAQGAPNGNAANGKKLFETIGCFECHGYAGQGGAAGPKLIEPPAWEDEVVVAEATTVESAVAEPEAPTPVVTDTAAADAAATDPEAPASATTPETPAR